MVTITLYLNTRVTMDVKLPDGFITSFFVIIAHLCLLTCCLHRLMRIISHLATCQAWYILFSCKSVHVFLYYRPYTHYRDLLQIRPPTQSPMGDNSDWVKILFLIVNIYIYMPSSCRSSAIRQHAII
jgi:hypothetical protein